MPTNETGIAVSLYQQGGLCATDQGFELRCPRCAAAMAGYDCPQCALSFRISEGIVHSLPPERIAHYARFIEQYEQIRAAEGRGGESAAVYLSLPYKDLTGKHAAQWRIRARSFDYLIGNILAPGLHASNAGILDLGAGNGWMSYRLRLARYRPVAVDLLVNDRDGLGAARHYRTLIPALFPRFRAEFAHLPFMSGGFDAVIFNSSFHYAEDAAAALREALRCTKPGGIVIISDTPRYAREESGHAMVAERRAAFLARYGTASDSIPCIEFLTNDRLLMLEEQLGIRWEIHRPKFGLRWTARPLIAKLRGRREPATFQIYVARKTWQDRPVLV